MYVWLDSSLPALPVFPETESRFSPTRASFIKSPFLSEENNYLFIKMGDKREGTMKMIPVTDKATLLVAFALIPVLGRPVYF